MTVTAPKQTQSPSCQRMEESSPITSRDEISQTLSLQRIIPSCHKVYNLAMGYSACQKNCQQDWKSNPEFGHAMLSLQMRGGLFLILYTASNLVLLSSCAIYVGAVANSGLGEISAESDNALVIPLILAVVPGCFFALARAVLLPDLKPKRLPDKARVNQS